MSDYLSNLVDRSLDRADVIQPRLPSLFEPAQGIGSPIAGLWQEAEPMMEVIEQSVPEARNSRSVERQPSPISRIFNRVIHRRSSESDSNPQLPSLSIPTATIEVSQPRFQLPPEVAQTGSVDRVEPTPDLPVAIESLSLQPQKITRQIVPDNISVEQPEIASQAKSTQLLPLDHTIDNPDRSPSLNPTPISVWDRTDQVQESSLTTTPSQNSPRLGQRMENTAMEQMRSVIQSIEPEVVSTPDQSSVPTIQVTIGRIEVRAITSAPATPAANTARSKPAVMSLDEYLNQRGGGR